MLSYTPWLNNRIARGMDDKRRIWRQYCCTNKSDKLILMAYKKKQKEVKGMIRRAKRDFERKLAKIAKKGAKEILLLH